MEHASDVDNLDTLRASATLRASVEEQIEHPAGEFPNGQLLLTHRSPICGKWRLLTHAFKSVTQWSFGNFCLPYGKAMKAKA